ncbi:hypothetical protein ACNOYE_02405 [Nannocystaceae bacterium ST9]
MKLPARLQLHLLAFLIALVGGLACDVISVPTGTSTATNAVAGAACPEWGSGKPLGASFTGKADVDANLGAFMQAALDIQRIADQSEANVSAACIKMGRDLGVPDDKLKSQDDDKVSVPCAAVAAQIDTILKGGVKISVDYQPPSCQMDANFKSKCEAECGMEVDPGKVVAECEPAKLSGYCQGTCSGSCEGTCNGQCSGECTAKDSKGNCIGECKGTCTGKCDSTCHAKCEGEWKAPSCEVEVEESKVKAECSANCEASADFRASCRPAKVDVKHDAKVEAAAKLSATLRANLPALLQAQIRLGKQLAGDLQVVVKTGNKLRGELQGAGAKAGACVSAAIQGLASASVKINVSVKASASVSGKAGAKAG